MLPACLPRCLQVVGCGATVLVLDPQLTPLSRTWCLFEVGGWGVGGEGRA